MIDPRRSASARLVHVGLAMTTIIFSSARQVSPLGMTGELNLSLFFSSSSTLRLRYDGFFGNIAHHMFDNIG